MRQRNDAERAQKYALPARETEPVFRSRRPDRLALERLVGRYDRLQVIWADAGYGSSLVGWAQATAGWSLESVRRPAQQHFLIASTHRHTRLFGGLGLITAKPSQAQES